MASFNLVVSGNPTLASDLNQYGNILNGSVAGQVSLLAANNTTTPLFAYLPSVPASDVSVMASAISGDAVSRVSSYIRSDGYGAFRAGTGSAATAHWYATSTGWKTDESVVVNTNLTVNGSTLVAGFTASNTTVNGTLSVAGNVTSSLQTTNIVWINKQTAFGAGTPAIDLAIGDNDTGINWVNDGNIQLMCNGGVVVNLVGGSFMPKTNTSGQTLYAGTSTPSGAEGDVWFKA